ncbi:TonB-linked SusC/RagA family outer membrane protein [Pontibacter ummariensis]|uniref:TonB-linked outer membrane protein, SusC/RagA family n=1 Tax=Pontibacter ummariensis TaxID=1610492 RepID=A0A239IDK6_9BACT|nr:SusC/RagA family TonB-linked outer membrane protein [Pontibacter ummariensis]PRY09807.1 TonB-linked SusC/RagA family outer membrane protein [Pontibacter ummariensis]SNS91846.1 TonB-linked outer membrane protein, SusC/RagA family [Pontibacter ummariensis]
MKRVLLLLCLLGFMLPVLAQQTLSGRVVSAADSSPLPGATVKLKDSNAGVTTNAEGFFSLPVSKDKLVLVVSFVGFAHREVPVNLPLEEPLVIALSEDDRNLQEVVVSTGYQNIPQERATGSFTQVSNATLNEQVGPDVLSRLESVANGVTVDRAGLEDQLMVRGLSSINGPRSPLIVVDNFPYEGDIRNINPNDVESVTILKDAAATSIWGARAGNGVIVITTKKGRFHQPLTATINANVTLSAKPDLSYLRQMSSSDFIDVEQFLFDNDYYSFMIGGYGYPVLSPVVELLDKKEKGTLPADEVEARINALRNIDVRDDYERYIYQRALRQQYALNLQSGSDVLAWSLSAGYDRNVDQLAAQYDRLNLRFQTTIRPAKGLTVTTGAYYTQSERTGGKPGYGEIGQANYYIYPYARFANENGSPLPVARDYSQSYKDTAGGGNLLDWNLYPLEDHKHVQDTRDVQDVLANLGVTYRWKHGLSAEVKYQYERQQSARRLLQDEGSYYTRNLINRYTLLDPETGAYKYTIPRGAILDRTQSLLESQNLRGQLNFDRNWDRHILSVIAGAEVRSALTVGYTSRLYGYRPDNLTFGSVDYTIPYPDLVTGAERYIPNMADEDEVLNRFVSQYANAAYTYGGRYTLSASARRDASNLFGLRTNDLWTPLWSTGLAWDVSREPFYKLGFLPYLKLRSTYGFSGNTNPAFTAVSTITYPASSPYTQMPYARFSTFANPDLTWETVGMWNTGLDFAIRGNRLSGSIEYYQKKAHDLFAMYPVDYTTGVGDQVMRNVAELSGHGIDVALNSINLDGAFQWTTQLNFSHSKDEITDYYLGTPLAYNLVTPGYLVTGIEGKPAYSLYSFKWAGLDPQTGDPLGYLDGEVSSDYFSINYGEANLDDLVYHGSAIPTFFGSLGNTFSWKGFSLTARLSWKLGYFFRANSISYSTLYSSWGGHSDFAQRWQKPGDEQHTNVPSMTYPDNFARDSFYAGSEVLVEKGDHIRLQYVSASYTLPAKGTKQGALKDGQVYLNLSNLGILWRANSRGLDPDRYNFNALPDPQSISLGFRATF